METYNLPLNFLLNNKYRIEKVLGQGGFGITYLAEDTVLDTKVCIKELFVSGSSTRGSNMTVLTHNLKDFSFADFKERFIQEAKQLAKFKHPNIVRVQDFFEANNTAYVVMEYIEGQTLKDKVAYGGPLSADTSQKIIESILDAVEVVHKAGMLHRDIKPDNLILGNDGRVVLIDFGSARAYSDEKTIAQTAMVSPGYAPLEQYNPSARKGTFTDIYSIGATFYFMLTAEKPLNVTERYTERLKAPHEINPNVSMQVSSAVMLAMEMKGEDRFQNVEDFRLALQQMAGGQKKKEEQKTVLNPKKENVINENSKTVHSSTPAGKNNKVIIFSLIGVAALVLILLVVFNPFGSGNNKPELEIEMVDVMGGSFLMGCTVEQGNNCFGNEFPVHQVTLSAYKIGKYEVTQAQWREVMGNNPSSFRDCDKCPVEQVNWNDVQDFISKLNEKTGKTYRLPTEAEWEFAARGGNGSRRYIYSGSNNLDDVAWYEVTGNSKTHEVGMKIPNELGIYDMSGNVWEWCSDWSGVYNAAEETNPSGATTGKNRVLRGGSWDFKAEYCRVSHSNSDLPIRRNDRIGFRLVLVP